MRNQIKKTKIMSNLVNKYFHNTKLIVAIKAPREIGNSFPFKDKVSEPKNNH